jgi:transcriptional regulator with XRE-family HTH domain
MFSINEAESEALLLLGRRLKRRRLQAGEPQARVAARLGVSLPTYRKLEKGDSSAQIGTWVRAIRLYGVLKELETLFPESLFDAAEVRRRAPRRRV